MSDCLYDEAMMARLEQLATTAVTHFRTNQPFPHIVIDDFVPAEVLEEVVRDFPAPDALPWKVFHNCEEKKLGFSEIERLPASLRAVLQFMNSAPLLRFLERVTEIENLIPDPYYVGGGLHQIRRGGHLGVHVDFNRDERLGLDRRLNVILYLNKDWPEEYGGHLELWDGQMQACRQRIAPLFNRCVVLPVTEESCHGHPQPLTCPENRTRQSLATYYYTNGSPDAVPAHSTIFRARPQDRTLARRLRGIIAQLTPPIVGTVRRKFRGGF